MGSSTRISCVNSFAWTISLECFCQGFFQAFSCSGFFLVLFRGEFLPCACSTRFFPCGLWQLRFLCAVSRGIFSTFFHLSLFERFFASLSMWFNSLGHTPCSVMQGLFPSAPSRRPFSVPSFLALLLVRSLAFAFLSALSAEAVPCAPLQEFFVELV